MENIGSSKWEQWLFQALAESIVAAHEQLEPNLNIYCICVLLFVKSPLIRICCEQVLCL